MNSPITRTEQMPESDSKGVSFGGAPGEGAASAATGSRTTLVAMLALEPLLTLKELKLLYRTGGGTHGANGCRERRREIEGERGREPVFRTWQAGEIGLAGVEESVVEQFV